MDETKPTSDEHTEVLDPGHPNLMERASEIDRKHERLVRSMKGALLRWIALGHELVAAKKQVREDIGPRQWETWLAENTEVAERTAQVAMRFANRETELRERLEAKSATVAVFTVREADYILRKTSPPKDEGDDDPDPDEDGDDPDPDSDDPNEDDPDDKQFEVLREAYEEASAAARDRFHQHLEEIYGLKVRSVKKKQQEQADNGAVTAAVKTSDAEPRAAEAGP
jgi:hypothetical protein